MIQAKKQSGGEESQKVFKVLELGSGTGLGGICLAKLLEA